jgi:hypothetical protein
MSEVMPAPDMTQRYCFYFLQRKKSKGFNLWSFLEARDHKLIWELGNCPGDAEECSREHDEGE